MKSPTPRGQVRARLLETAGRLFHEQGYRATGLEQLLEAAGVAKASFYKHFPTKEDLVVAVLADLSEEALRTLRAAARAQPDPERRFEALLSVIARQLEDDAWRGCTFLNLHPEFPVDGHPAREVVAGHKSAVAELVADLVDAMPSQADVAPPDRRRRAEALHLLAEGALVQAQLDRHANAFDAARDAGKTVLHQPL